MIDILIPALCIGIPGLALFFAFRSIWRDRNKAGSDGESGSWTYTSDSGGDSGGGGDGGD